MDEQILPLLKSFLGQINSAMKVSELIANHASSDEITVDHLIIGLVYRLMVPMTNTEITEALESAEQLLDKLDNTDSDDEYDNVSECYDKIDFGYRKVIPPICNCSVCMKARINLLNYKNHDCSDPLSQKFKDAIETCCIKHKIVI